MGQVRRKEEPSFLQNGPWGSSLACLAEPTSGPWHEVMASQVRRSMISFWMLKRLLGLAMPLIGVLTRTLLE